MQIAIYIIIFLIGAIVGRVLFHNKYGRKYGRRTSVSNKYGRRTSVSAPASSERMYELGKEAQIAIRERTDKRKTRIMELARKQEKITNDDVEDMFCISDSTARNYLDDLEHERKLEQVGETGRGVHYVIADGSQSLGS